MKTIIDPPEGWKYGFPKELPSDVEDLGTWLLKQGYPGTMLELALQYSRYWKEEDAKG